MPQILDEKVLDFGCFRYWILDALGTGFWTDFVGNFGCNGHILVVDWKLGGAISEAGVRIS